MPHYIAFLRAINVGGHNVKMGELRTLFASLGLRNVDTFIASGNVTFDSPARRADTLERQIERLLHQALGYEVATFLRSPAELAAIAAHAPFGSSAPVADGCTLTGARRTGSAAAGSATPSSPAHGWRRPSGRPRRCAT